MRKVSRKAGVNRTPGQPFALNPVSVIDCLGDSGSTRPCNEGPPRRRSSRLPALALLERVAPIWFGASHSRTQAVAVTTEGPKMSREDSLLYELVVRNAKASDAETLAGIIADGLFDDPPNVWAFPDPARRRVILPRFFRLFVEESIDSDAAFILDDLAAVSLWFPPGWDMSDEQA